MPSYEVLGPGYATTRRADPRIAAQIVRALGDAERVLNVGAGTGNYEPVDRTVVAVEPSPTMIGQRDGGSSRVVRGVAEALPVRDGAFDAAMASLTMHHWSDLAAGLEEMLRVARRQVVFMFEPGLAHQLWLLEYWPELEHLASEQAAPSPAAVAEMLDVRRVEVVPIHHDCSDGFAGAFWRRPERYLDPAVRAGMSCCAQLAADAECAGAERLRADLASGAWDARHGGLRRLESIDVGYRLVIAGR